MGTHKSEGTNIILNNLFLQWLTDQTTKKAPFRKGTRKAVVRTGIRVFINEILTVISNLLLPQTEYIKKLSL